MKQIPKLHKFVFSVIPIFGSLASMVLGYFIVYLTMLQEQIAAYNDYSQQQSELYFTLMTASLPVGAFISALFYNRFVDRFGEKLSMKIMDFLAIGAVCLHLVSLNIYVVCVARLLMGLYCGITTGLIPSWIISMAPSYKSGIFGTFNQLAITIGMAEAYFMGQFLQNGIGNEQIRVKIFIGLPIMFSFVHLFGLRFFGFDNIQRLIQQRHNTEVITYMKTIYGPNWKKFEKEIRKFKMLPEEIKSIKEARQGQENEEQPKQSEKQKDQISMDERIAHLKKKLTQNLKCSSFKNTKMAFMLAIANHASGLIAIFQYSKQLFERIEGYATADTVVIFLGFFQVVVTFVSGFLINRYGRRPMMLIGQAIVVVSLLFCGLITMTVEKHEVIITLAIFLYTLGYSISLGPLFMMYAIETFSNMTMVIAVYWGMMILFTFTTDFLIEEMDISMMFFIFFGCSALSLVYFFKKMIQTKGVSKKQIKQMVERNAADWQKSGYIFSQSTSVTKDPIATSSGLVANPDFL